MEYKILAENFYDENIGNYTAYGISSDEGYKFSDITLSKQEIEHLVANINVKQTPVNYLPYEIDAIF